MNEDVFVLTGIVEQEANHILAFITMDRDRLFTAGESQRGEQVVEVDANPTGLVAPELSEHQASHPQRNADLWEHRIVAHGHQR